MFTSLTSRIVTVTVLVVLALFALVAMMADATRQSRESFEWVNHSSLVIQTMEETMASLREAESGQRGYILTKNAGLAQSFDRRIEEARGHYSKLYDMTLDNPTQNQRLQAFSALMDERIELMHTPLQMARQNSFENALAMVIEGRGHDTMNALTLIAQEFLQEEENLLKSRIEASERRLEWGRGVALIGGPIVALVFVLLAAVVVRGIRHPTRVLTLAMTRLGQGELDVRIHQNMGSLEFGKLAKGYNAMAEKLESTAVDQKRAKLELSRMNEEMTVSSQIMQERGKVIELLGAMSHRMQATRTDEELAEVISIFVPRVLPDLPGALYGFNNSRNLLTLMSQWGEALKLVDGFAPDQCWALRRGQDHYVSGKGKDIICAHVDAAVESYHCEPLLASGEVIGVLYLDGLLDEEARFRLNVLAENISSAMVNRRLQRDLKEQTIRDPLTGLFNRRYMEEALAMEVARSARSKAPLSVIMCDIDHFKRFNDEFGHDAGDVVLSSVAKALGELYRDGDIVCRFGGEEFTIIAPGTTKEALGNRTEQVRLAISRLSPQLRNEALGPVTMSFGIAQWTPDMKRDGADLLQHADTALYRSKREGRNRISLHQSLEALQPDEE